MPSRNTRTRIKPFRISNAHAYMIDSKFASKGSALVRVLLTLYFNKHLDAFNIEELVSQDVKRATSLEEEKLKEFHEKLRNQRKNNP